MSLIDHLTQMFAPGGGSDAQASTDGLMAQLGLDPAVVRQRAGMQGLSQFGAAMLANAGPSTQPRGFAQALGQGLQAGQAGYGDATSAQIAQLATLMQLSKMQGSLKDQADERARRAAAPAKLQALLDDPENGLGPQEKKLVTTLLATGETDKAGQLLATFMGREKAPKTPQIITRPDGSIVAVDPNTLTGTQVMGGVARPHEPRAPTLLEQLKASMSPEQFQAYMNKTAGIMPQGHGTGPGGKVTPVDTANQKAALKAMGELNDAIPQIDQQIQASDEMMGRLTPGKNGQPAEYDFGNGLTRWGANMLPQAMKPDKVVDAQKNYGRLVLGDIPGLKTRITNFEFGQLQKLNPSVEVSAAENLRILKDRRRVLDAIKGRLTKEAAHYGNGGSVQDWIKSGGGLNFGDAAGAIDAGAAQPQQQGQDGPDLLTSFLSMQGSQ